VRSQPTFHRALSSRSRQNRKITKRNDDDRMATPGNEKTRDSRITKRTQQVIENTENQPPFDVYFERTQAGRTLVSAPALEKLNFAARAYKTVRCAPRLDPARSAGQSRLHPAGQTGGPGCARSPLAQYSRRADQRDQANADDSGRQDRVRRRVSVGAQVNSISTPSQPSTRFSAGQLSPNPMACLVVS
jgi:hypothetical protein